MRRALLPEAELAALRTRCVDLGLLLQVRGDARGNCVLLVGDRSFSELHRAVAHIEALEREVAR
jgi:hypothetical protein